VYRGDRLPFKRDLPVVPFALMCSATHAQQHMRWEQRANGGHRRFDGRVFFGSR
jgi:hypothetical protein